MNKIIIPLGVVSGLALSVAMLYPLTMNDFSHAGEESTGYIEMLLASSGAIIAMIIISRKNAEIKFSKLIKYGVITSLITVLVLFVANVIYLKIINPGYLNDYVNALTQKKAATITDAAKKAEFIASAEKDKYLYTNPSLYSFIIALTRFMISLMPIAICGYILFRVNRWKIKKAEK